MSDRKIAAIWPLSAGKNAYFRIVSKAIENCGCEIKDIYNLLFRCVGTKAKNAPVFLNNYDEIRPSSGVKGYLRYATRSLLLSLMVFRKFRIVPVIHNKVPHENGNVELSIRMRRLLCKRAYRIVILCKKTLEVLADQLPENLYIDSVNKTVLIPHPSYENEYQETQRDWRKELGSSKNDFLLSFSGLIRPYKNIELIIQTAKDLEDECPNLRIAIVGEVLDRAYEQELNELLSNVCNVSTLFEFIPDGELPSFVRASNALILPYDIKSSLNSSSCVLAFSYGRTVICPKIGTIEEFPSELTYSYEYETSEDHLRNLRQAVLQAYSDWKENSSHLEKKGNELREIMREKGSVKELTNHYSAIISNI